MLEYEGAALIHVALQARRLATQGLLDQARPLRHAPRGCESAMRIMAVGTLHEAFIDPVLRRHIELGADGGVARVAKFALFPGEQELGRGGMVNRVTTGTGYIV